MRAMFMRHNRFSLLFLIVIIGSSIAFANNHYLNSVLNNLSSVKSEVFSARIQINLEPLNLAVSQLQHADDGDNSSEEDPSGGHCSRAKDIVSSAITVANNINSQVQKYNLLTGNTETVEARKLVNPLKAQVQQFNALIQEAILEVKMAISYWDENH
jgi:hypothetical protein